MPNLTSVGVANGVPNSGTGTVSTIDALMADGGQTTIGAKADAKSTATDTTAVTAMSVWKQISASVQAIASSVAGTLTASLSAAANGDVGKTNIRHINVAGTTLTRPANTTAYSALDSVSDNATAGSVTALPITVSDTNDDPVDITEVLLDSTDTGFGSVQVRVHLFTSDPTASTGVGGGDNAAWSQKRAGWAGSFSGTMVAFSDGSKGVLIPDGGPVRVMNVESGGKRVWWQLQTLGAATPSANSTTFTPRIKGYQGRA